MDGMLVAGRSKSIGLVMNTPIATMSEYLSEVVAGLLCGAETQQVNVTLFTCTIPGPGRSALDALTRLCRAREVAGIILMWSSGIDAAIQILQRESLPFVVFGRRVNDPLVSWIAPDNYRGAYSATRHLIALGHRRIAYIAYPEMGTTNTDRLAGFSAAHQDERLPIDESLIIPLPVEPESGYQALRSLIERPTPPTAVFAFNDTTAAQMQRAAIDLGRRVPNDLAVVGFGGLHISATAAPSLTTVSAGMAIMAEQAVEMLMGRLANPEKPALRRMTPVSLIVRASTIGV